MKRFAAHYVLLPAVGFMKRQVVEVTDEGTVQKVFPLTEEMESVEWLPGVIALLTVSEIRSFTNNAKVLKNFPLFVNDLPIVCERSSHCFQAAFDNLEKQGEVLFPCLFYPFDFTSMKPVAETRHRLLR